MNLQINNINYNKLNSILLFLFCFILIFDPSNQMLKMKEIVAIFLVIYIIITFKYDYFNHILYTNLFFLYIVVYTFFSGLFSSVDINYSFYLGFVKSFFVFFILSFCKYEDFEKTFFYSLKILVIISLSFYLVYSFFPNENIEKIAKYLLFEVNNLIIGDRVYGEFEIFILYYKTVPLVILLIGYLLNKKSYSLAIISIFVLFISGTRANMLAALLIPLLYIYFLYSYKIRIILFSSLLFLILINIDYFLSNFLSKVEYSNSVKLGHFYSYIEYFKNNPLFFFFGSGAGSYFYSHGVSDYVLNTELVFLDLIRYIGIINTVLFYIVILYPIRKIYYKSNIIAFSYFIYIIVAMTNPLLISSTGFLAISFAYLFAYSKDKNAPN